MNKKKRKERKKLGKVSVCVHQYRCRRSNRESLERIFTINRSGLTRETRLFHEMNSRFRELESTRDSGDMSDGGAATLPVIGPNSTSSTPACRLGGSASPRLHTIRFVQTDVLLAIVTRV